MNLKALRRNRGWSQEHLAALSGLNVRTIQRVESGKRASLETLMALASALEVDVSTLEQALNSSKAGSRDGIRKPLWVKLVFRKSGCRFALFRNPRKGYRKLERVGAIGGIALILLGVFLPGMTYLGMVMLALAYYFSFFVKVGDKYKVWCGSDTTILE